MFSNTLLVWIVAVWFCAMSFFVIMKIYNHKSQYEITFFISPDLYNVLDSLAGENETVEEYIGRLCQEVAETEWYVNKAQIKEKNAKN